MTNWAKIFTALLFYGYGKIKQLDKIQVDHITVGCSNITPVKRARNLGFTIDSTMSLHQHISQVVQSTSNNLRNLSKIRKHLSQQATKQLVHAFITIRLDMCNSLLYGIHQKQPDRLQLKQNTAARLITRSRRSSHVTSTLCNLHWLPIKFRIIYKLMILTHRSKHGTAPSYLSELTRPYNPSRSGLRSASQHLPTERRSYRSWGDRSFRIAAPRLWNSLPHNIRSISSLNSFKTTLKTHLMVIAYNNTV